MGRRRPSPRSGRWVDVSCRARRCASALPFRRMHDKAIQRRAQTDLTGKARIRPLAMGEVEHVPFVGGWRTDPIDPRGIDMNMAGRAGGAAAAFPDDILDARPLADVHHRLADIAVQRGRDPGRVMKVTWTMVIPFEPAWRDRKALMPPAVPDIMFAITHRRSSHLLPLRAGSAAGRPVQCRRFVILGTE